jgi:hypothetical protein
MKYMVWSMTDRDFDASGESMMHMSSEASTVMGGVWVMQSTGEAHYKEWHKQRCRSGSGVINGL